MASRAEWFHEVVSGRRQGTPARLWRLGLAALSIPYAWGIGVRNRLYDTGWKQRYQAAVPVISVGNLTLGGTGKTPVVQWLCQFYRARGLRVAILSRGYGSRKRPNDEAVVLRQNLPDVPHLQGPDRSRLAQQAVREWGSQLLILDDGFQHRRLHRDLDIVLVDATNPWGYGRLFPRGLLREPPTALARADVVWLTRCDQVPGERLHLLRTEVRRYAPRALLVESVHAPLALSRCVLEPSTDGRAGQQVLRPAAAAKRLQASPGCEDLAGRPVAAFCGIGNPEAFRRTLQKLGTRITDFRVFPDHHDYTESDIAYLHAWAAEQPPEAFVLTTQKDLVKVCATDLAGRPLLALQVAIRVTSGGHDLQQRLEGVVP
jgi:tetraacyldisaccharide 4'-kinase